MIAFADAATRAAQIILELKERSVLLDQVLIDRHQAWRHSQGLPKRPRAGSTVSRVLDSLLSTPVVTVGAAQAKLGVSQTAAEHALNELADAEVLSRCKEHRGATTAYVSDGHLSLVTLPEHGQRAGSSDTAERAPHLDLDFTDAQLTWHTPDQA